MEVWNMSAKIMLALLLAFNLGCGREDSNPTGGSPIPQQEPIEEAIVRANCLTVQAAAEKFARLNDGVFPLDVGTDALDNGYTVTDLLPEFCLLENPYTLAASEPWDGEAANQGETGYEPVGMAGTCAGYVITGTGEEAGHALFTLTDIDSPEGWVKRNCALLLQALSYFASENNDEYPADIDSDTSSAGMTAESYLWGYSLRNPYNGTTAHPVNGTAFLPGEIGYEPILDGDVVYACKVNGVGASPGDIVAELRGTRVSEEWMVEPRCLQVICSVDWFAFENEGRYPKDIDSDTNDRGYALLDYLHGRFANPFTQSLTEPRNGRAHNPGEIGYEAIDGGRGYLLTGAGKTPGDIIFAYSVMDSPADTTVKSNCAKARRAVEDFTAMNGGIPPKDVDRDTTLTGKTVLDLLPGGALMLNPITGRRTEPRNRTAAYPGEIGYFYDSRRGSGYVITGVGDKGTYIIRKSVWTGADRGKKITVQR
jgi:hypothetical protein